MEGPFHIPEKHRRLFEKEERIDRGAIQTISRSISQTPRVTTPTRVAPTPVTYFLYIYRVCSTLLKQKIS